MPPPSPWAAAPDVYKRQAESFAALDADIFSVQETKMQPGQADFAPEGYTEYTYSAEKKGYSGTCLLYTSRCV